MPSRRTSSSAASTALYAALLFGASERYVAAWLRLMRHSGSPTKSTAREASTATCSARGSALPTSSLAKTIMRRAMNRGSSPPAIMEAR